jgi:Ni/Fe-hydrogenase 1 B-type cytochrome subunit
METKALSQPAAGAAGSELIRAYVWELPVRLTHWVTFFSFAVLAFTGYYLHHPFITAASQNPFLMAKMRFVHIVTGFVFTLSFLLRMYWMFRGNRCARWPAFVPIRRRQWRGMGQMILYYSFLRWHPTHRIGHNALASVVYLFIFLVMFGQILTGFALYSYVLNHSAVSSIFGWLPRLINIQYLRGYHYFVMFGIFAFMIHHVYSAILVSAEEENGLVESIFTGYKFIPAREIEEEGPCEVIEKWRGGKKAMAAR